MKKTNLRAARLMPTLVCAWCNHVIRYGARKVSHGICRPCTVRWFGKLRPRRLLSPA
jgi:hypothetical protein